MKRNVYFKAKSCFTTPRKVAVSPVGFMLTISAIGFFQLCIKLLIINKNNSK